jgi:biotin carboxylase
MPRVLVILPTSSYRTPDFVRAAERLGLDLVVASDQPPPLEMGDRYVPIDCADPEAAAAAIVAVADRSPIDAVIAADDAGVLTASLASRALGTPHHPPAAAAATRDKLEMRRRLAGCEVAQPDFRPVDPARVGSLLEAGQALGYPLVLKPRTGSGSRGVLRVDDEAAAPAALGIVARIATELGEHGALVAERWIPGEEVALEGMMVRGELRRLAIFDKPDTPTGPTFPETLLVTPSRHPEEVLTELERVVAAACAGLGLEHGPVHAEAIVDPSARVHLLEVAARSIGGLCSRTLRFGLMGASLEELILATALGRDLASGRQPAAAGVMMLPVESAGTLVEVAGLEAARSVAGVTEIDITIPPGTPVMPLPDGDRYLGFVFAAGRTRDQVVDTLRRGRAMLEVRIA